MADNEAVYGLTKDGFRRKRLPEILADINKRVADRLGVEIQTGSNSLFGQLHGVYAYEIADLWEQAEDVCHVSEYRYGGELGECSWTGWHRAGGRYQEHADCNLLRDRWDKHPVWCSHRIIGAERQYLVVHRRRCCYHIEQGNLCGACHPR